MPAQRQLLFGAQVYAQHCAICHGANGEGGRGGAVPRLVGPERPLAGFGSAATLFGFVSAVMPQNAPGSLSASQYYAVTAYLLSLDHLSSGGQVVGPTTANGIRFH